MDPAEKEKLFLMLVQHLKTLVQERDKFAHKVVEISLASPKTANDNMESLSPEKNHLALEVSEFKAKIRKLNQQLWVKNVHFISHFAMFCLADMSVLYKKFTFFRSETRLILKLFNIPKVGFLKKFRKSNRFDIWKCQHLDIFIRQITKKCFQAFYIQYISYVILKKLHGHVNKISFLF